MVTFKQQIRKRWWIGNAVLSIGFLGTISIAVTRSNDRYLLILIPVIVLAHLLGNTKCPRCDCVLFIRPGNKAIEKLNYCQNCGLDLNVKASDSQ